MSCAQAAQRKYRFGQSQLLKLMKGYVSSKASPLLSPCNNSVTGWRRVQGHPTQELAWWWKGHIFHKLPSYFVNSVFLGWVVPSETQFYKDHLTPYWEWRMTVLLGGSTNNIFHLSSPMLHRLTNNIFLECFPINVSGWIDNVRPHGHAKIVSKKQDPKTYWTHQTKGKI